MATKKKVEVDVDINVELEPSLKALRDLKKQLKETAAGSDDFKRLTAQIDDMEDALKGAKAGAADWIDSLENAGGPLGMVGAGINKMKVAFTSFNTALKASIIGLIVSALAGLVAAFSQNESAMKKLEPLFIGLQRILGGIFRAMEPLLDAFMEMVDFILPPLTKGIGIFYSVLFGLFTLVKDVGVGVGKTLKGIFTFDWNSITEGVSQVANSIGNSVKAGEQAYARFQAGAKEQTKIEKDNLAERNKNADEARRKREEAEKKAEEERKKKEEERKKNLDEANKVINDAYVASLSKRDQELYRAGEEYNKNLLALEKAGITDKTLVQEQYRLKLDEINKKFDDEEEKNRKEKLEKEKKERQDALQKQLDDAKGDYQKSLEAYQALQQELTNNTNYSEQERVSLRKTYSDQILSIIDTQFANETAKIEEKYGEFARFDEQFYTDQRAALENQNQQLKTLRANNAISEDEFQKRALGNSKAKRELDKLEVKSQQDKVALVGDALGNLSSIVGKDTIAGKAFAIAKATIDTYQSAVSAYKALSGIPVIGPALGAIAAAAAVASGIATVKKIVQVQVPGGPGGASGSVPTTPGNTTNTPPPIQVNAVAPQRRAAGGLVRGPGTATSDSIPALLSDGEFVVNARSTQLFRPLLSAINATAGMPQFAVGGLVNGRMRKDPDNSERIAEAVENAFASQPIRTYVTAADISNQQQFDRVIKSRSLI
jgi:hypothetical protein